MRRIVTLLCISCIAALTFTSQASAATAAPPTPLKLSPSYVTFGTVLLGSESYKPISIINRTNTTLSYAGASWPNLQHPELAYPYGIWNASDSPFPCYEIAPKSSCSLTFRFVPASTGAFSSTFYMLYTDGTSTFTSNTILMRGYGQ